MEKQIRVVVKNADCKPEAKIIPNTLEACKEIVGGYIESFDPCLGIPDVWGVCNEEGLLIGLPINYYRPFTDYPIVGNIFFCRVDDEGDFASLTDEDIKELMEALDF